MRIATTGANGFVGTQRPVEVLDWADVGYLATDAATVQLKSSSGKLARLHPVGQVHVNGELWEARSTAEADVGDTVIVRALDGLTLLVEPEPRLGSSHRDDVGADGVRFANGHYKRKETHGH